MLVCNLVFSVQEFLKIIPGLALFPLSFYLAWKKLGTNISVSYAVNHERTLPVRITPIVLHNHKDRPINVFAIYAVINNDVCFEIDNFNPPITLKPLESLNIEPRPYSGLYFSTGYYEPDFTNLAEDIEIYIAVRNKVIHCKTTGHPNLYSFSKSALYRMATKETRTFNGLVYNENTIYAILFRMNSNVCTAFIDSTGFIGRGWNYRFNMIPEKYMTNKDTVRTYLEMSDFDKFSEWFMVEELQN